jgi:hypothetical protein
MKEELNDRRVCLNKKVKDCGVGALDVKNVNNKIIQVSN